jgi:hypothetical protein
MKMKDSNETKGMLGEAARGWYSKFGLQVIPMMPGKKIPAVKWDAWFEDLSPEKIDKHWKLHPDHDIGCLMGDDLIMFDADTPEAIANLVAIEESFGVKPKLLVKTARGEHHWLRRKPGTFASPDGHDSKKHPGRIDIRTGRSMAILPPSTNKVAIVHEAHHVSELTEVCQSFIDAVYLMNDREPPRPREETPNFSRGGETHSVAKLRALLGHIDPDCGYQDWLNVLMAVHTETGGSEDGLALVDEWSSKGSKYDGSQAVRLKWRSFKNNLERSIKIGTINKMVEATGVKWQDVIDPFEICEGEVIELSEPVAEVAEPSKVGGTILDRFTLTGRSAELEKAAVKQVPIFGEVGLMGQATAWYAEPNSGKTLLAMKLMIDAIVEGRIDPGMVYYLNLDDTSSGLYQKVKIAEEFGFHMLAEGHQSFSAKKFIEHLRELILEGQSHGVVIIADTLKKLVDLMKKDHCSDFSADIRNFVSKGGTFLALAHTNKHKRDGKPVPGGTSDIRDDFDCVFTIDTVNRNAGFGEKVVAFENIKRRGNVADSVAYSYFNASDITYEERLLSIRIVDVDQLEPIRQAEQLRTDAELIGVAITCISEGIDSKMLLARAISERSGVSRVTALNLIDRYTGDDPSKHRWQAKRGAHGKLTYELLEQAPAVGPPLTTLDNEDLF